MPEYTVAVDGRTYLVRVTGAGPALEVAVDGLHVPVRMDRVAGGTQFQVTAGDQRQCAVIRRSGADLIVTLADEQYRLHVEPAAPIARRTRGRARGASEVKAPIPGLIVSVEVAEGDAVEQGRPVAVMEAMKMQSELRAPCAGTVTAVHVRAGQEVMGGAVLVAIAPGAPDAAQGRGRET